MEKFYFSLGCGQPLQKYYVLILAPNAEIAITVMQRQFGSCYCSLYYDKRPFMENLKEILIDSNEVDYE